MRSTAMGRKYTIMGGKIKSAKQNPQSCAGEFFSGKKDVGGWLIHRTALPDSLILEVSAVQL